MRPVAAYGAGLEPRWEWHVVHTCVGNACTTAPLRRAVRSCVNGVRHVRVEGSTGPFATAHGKGRMPCMCRSNGWAGSTHGKAVASAGGLYRGPKAICLAVLPLSRAGQAYQAVRTSHTCSTAPAQGPTQPEPCHPRLQAVLMALPRLDTVGVTNVMRALATLQVGYWVCRSCWCDLWLCRSVGPEPGTKY